jgi:hypothetical protein
MKITLKAIGLFVLGLIVYSISKTMGGALGAILTIVGVILMIGGPVEVFRRNKKVKIEPESK